MTHRSLLLGLLIALASIASAHATTPKDALRIGNELRVRSCGRHAAKSPLLLNNKLSLAATRLRNGEKLHDAILHAGYRADRSAVIHIGGRLDADSLAQMLKQHYCGLLTEDAFSEAGIAIDGNDVWMVLAAPFAPPAMSDANIVAHRVLVLVNEARSKARSCGNKRFPAAASLQSNEILTRAAVSHAKDMAAHNQVEHEGSDGSSPADRATRAGYTWKSIGENVAGGQLSAEEVVAGWLSSPGHCSNIMDKDFTQMGIAFVVDTRKSIGIYWAQSFGQPR